MGAGVNGDDGWGRPPLVLAAYTNRVVMVKFLLARGADPTIRCHGRPLVHYLLVCDDYTEDWMALRAHPPE